MRTLIVDNYDSFTFNLFQLIAAINGETPIVVRNDQVSWEALAGQPFENIVLSPGPGRPERDADFGVCRRAILEAKVPLLGVCLGHQGIGQLYGGRVVHAPEPMHGRLSPVEHDGSELWAGIPQGFRVVRYHSLVVDPHLPEALRRTAWTPDGIVMGLRHATLPRWGVQFHPESICTEHGERLLTNFRDLTHRQSARRTFAPGLSIVPEAAPAPEAATGFRLLHRRVEARVELPLAYERLFHRRDGSFWLDSSRAEPGLSRFSFMGAAGGPNGLTISYDATAREVTERRGDETRRLPGSLWDYLARELARRRCAAPELPFDFACGFAGWFGYELEPDAEAPRRHRSELPDACLVLADRLAAFDHHDGAVVFLCLLGPGDDDAIAHTWLDETERALRELRPSARPPSDRRPIPVKLARPRAGYLEDIAACRSYIRDGESYEICLTNRLHADAAPDPLELYATLRRVNPAPYSAFLSFGDVTVMSSSPERFLRVGRDGTVESKPIKGTRPRGATPVQDVALARELAASEKDRSENLMIVDLMRNDLGKVCEVGSVHVPKLMEVESYQTVHQLVSTVRGRLKPGLGAIDALRHAFPGGSVTGAPKLRTMRIIDELETEPRGPYTGAIGFLSLDGSADLNIVIRTLVAHRGRVTIGTGGAIVMLSDPASEFDEIMLKARALLRALAGGDDDAAFEAALRTLAERGEAIF